MQLKLIFTHSTYVILACNYVDANRRSFLTPLNYNSRCKEHSLKRGFVEKNLLLQGGARYKDEHSKMGVCRSCLQNL
jgi:hypothetical protein